jgi:hypothetical protein
MLWQTIFDGPASLRDYIVGMSILSEGEAAFGGYSFVTNGLAVYTAGKLNLQSGAIKWFDQIAIETDNAATGFATDSAGFAHVAGTSDPTTFGQSRNIGYVRWRLSDGTAVVQESIDGVDPSMVGVAAVAAYPDGGVIVGNTSSGEIELRRMSSNGERIWYQVLDEIPGFLFTHFRQVRVSADGAIYIASWGVNALVESQCIVAKLNGETGDILWWVAEPAARTTAATYADMFLEILGNGDVVVASTWSFQDLGDTTVRRLSGIDGSEAWRIHPSSLQARTFDLKLVAGNRIALLSSDMVLRCYSSDNGSFAWSRSVAVVGGTNFAVAIGVAPDGSLRTVGRRQVSPGLWKVILAGVDSQSGGLLWNITLPGTASNLSDIPMAVVVQGDGTAIVASGTGSSPSEVTLLQAVSPSGSPTWMTSYIGAFRVFRPMAADLDVDGNVYVLAATNSTGSNYGAAIARFRSDGGGVDWVYTSPSFSSIYTPYGGYRPLAVSRAGSVWGVFPGRDAGNEQASVAVSLAQPVNVELSTFAIEFGVPVSGDIESLRFSDDSYLVVRESPPLGLGGPSMTVRFTANGPSEPVSLVQFVIEVKVSAVPASSVPMRIELFNYVTQSYNALATVASSLSDQVVVVSSTFDPSPYLHPTTREIRSRVRFYDPGSLFSFGWRASIDHAFFRIAER